ncbi:MAG TPA: guanylate kinase [Bdellovibrionota bacterium]|nr:guanylate kinase [Bdellovibrionota bacterium]
MVSAPSGAGKTTLVKRLLRKDRRIHKTISHTTRSPRSGERDGRDYFFISKTVFQRMISKKSFVEWARVYGDLYGTSKRTIDGILRKGKDAVLVIEAQGARSIRKKFRNAVFILIVPPSLLELKRRISRRGGEGVTEMKRRLRAAKSEIRAMRWYDYVVVNERIHNAVTDLHIIIQAERLELARRRSLIQILAGR